MPNQTLFVTSLLISLGTVTGQATAQVGCSQQEQKLLNDSTPHLMQALLALDIQKYAAMLQQLQNSLSSSCLAALQQQQQSRQMYRSSPEMAPEPRVYDHGGGTHSVPGIGACGPSGCVAF